ncbi:MAG: hypothetical protein JO293_07750 [Candidatus Eremiobacteraeota bacterium]|nr:hypothetical protein [Candidatus Eremiobacteraeota bacterium]
MTGEDGHSPVIPSLPTASLTDLQTKAGYVLDLANKLLVDNAQGIHNTVDNIQTFSLALRNNAGNVDAALKSVSELGKTIEPLATRLQTLSEDADKLVVSIDPGKVRAIVDNVETVSGKAGSVIDRADKVLADNAGDIRTTIKDISAFAQTLDDNRGNVEAALKGAADLGKAVQPAAERIQTLAEDADKIAKAIEPDKVRSIVDNVQSLAGKASSVADRANQVLADNASDIHTAITGISAFATTLSDNRDSVAAAIKGAGELGKNVPRIQGLVDDADKVVRAVDTDKLHGAVDNVESFSRALSASSDNYQTVMREGASLAARLNDASQGLGGTITDVDNIF